MQKEGAKREGHKFNEDNLLRIRRNSRLNQSIFLSKLVLKKHGSVQIEGMGECISLVSKISQILNKNGFVEVVSIKSENVERENSKAINPKLIIELKKSKEFDKMTADIELKNKEEEKK